jgi:ribose transport system ATP-binding protein
VLTVKDISKSFPGIKALDKVSIDFYEGELHGVIGENGAGKSTLMNILCGVHLRDEGEVLLDGKPLEVLNLRDALTKGISIVHQELQVLNISTVAENIMIDKLSGFSKGGFINWQKVNKEAKKYLDYIGLDIPPTTKIGELSSAHKKMVQITKALSSNSKIMLLDEPTSAISEREAVTLFEILKKLKTEGLILIYVSHKLEEVIANCERISVLRDGKLIGTNLAKNLDKKMVVSMMLGREERIETFSNENVNKEIKILEVKDMTKKNKVNDINLDLYEGEILGIYGLVGSGRTEFARLLIGEDRWEKGEVFLNGKKITVKSIPDSIYKYKIGYVTENRKEEGLFLKENIRMNVNVIMWPLIAGRILKLIKKIKENKNAQKMIKDLDIRATSMQQVVGKLSGGNQQKVSIAKWLITDCNIIIFDEPTIGVDIGAKKYIHQLIYDLASLNKKSIILISSDMPEIITLSNRIIVFDNRKIIGEVKTVAKNENSYDEVSKEIGNFYL